MISKVDIAREWLFLKFSCFQFLSKLESGSGMSCVPRFSEYTVPENQATHDKLNQIRESLELSGNPSSKKYRFCLIIDQLLSRKSICQTNLWMYIIPNAKKLTFQAQFIKFTSTLEIFWNYSKRSLYVYFKSTLC